MTLFVSLSVSFSLFATPAPEQNTLENSSQHHTVTKLGFLYNTQMHLCILWNALNRVFIFRPLNDAGRFPNTGMSLICKRSRLQSINQVGGRGINFHSASVASK